MAKRSKDRGRQPGLLFLGGGVETAEGVRRAKEFGYAAFVVDGNVQAPGRALADGFLQANPYSPEETLAALESFGGRDRIDGVLALGTDSTVTVAGVAAALGIPGPSIETARLTTDKLLMKHRLRECGVPIPWFAAVASLGELESHMRLNPNKAYVLKPVDSRGARGILFIERSSDLAWAYDHSLRHSPSHRLILEEWIEGPQYSTESVVWEDRAVLCGLAFREYDRTKHLRPHLIEDGGYTPADVSAEDERRIADVAHSAGRALGLRRGTLKGDIIMGPSGPVVVEVAARLSGGYFSTHNIPLVYGINILDAAIAIAIGREPEWSKLKPKVRLHAANRFLFLPPGIVQSVEYDERLAREPWVVLFKLYVQKGSRVEPVTDHTKRSGAFMTVGDTRQQALDRATRLIESIKVSVS